MGLFDNLKDQLSDAVGVDISADSIVEATDQVAELSQNVADTAESVRDTTNLFTGE